MQAFRRYVAALASVLISSCGGSADPVVPSPALLSNAELVHTAKFDSLISFGDSLSDVGTYAVGAVKSAGGGKFTINAPDTKIWIEHIALQLGVPAPCAAQTGLNGDPAQGYSVPVTNFPGCTAYAQGGARVSEWEGTDKGSGLGALSAPISAQIQNYLATHGGHFSAREAVFVMAGGNDLLAQLRGLADGTDPIEALGKMITAGTELGRQAKSVVAAGATHVVVVNLPDASVSPILRLLPGVGEHAIQAMVRTFNAALRQEIEGTAEILYVDAYTRSQAYNADPAQFGLINTTTPACDLSPQKNPLASSLICTAANVISGPINRYAFADYIHPTPYGHQLLAALVASEMTRQGWLQ